MHEARIRRNGDPDKVIHQKDRDLPRGEDHPRWTGDEVTYFGIHQRLRKQRGSASGYACVQCGGQAKQWALIRTDSSPQPHSADLDDYQPMCISCHKKYDLDALSGSVIMGSSISSTTVDTRHK